MELKAYLAMAPRGTASKLAASLGISPSYLSQLSGGSSPISPGRCVAIERETRGAVTRKDMRPEDWDLIWPELTDLVDRANSCDDTQPPTGGKTDSAEER